MFFIKIDINLYKPSIFILMTSNIFQILYQESDESEDLEIKSLPDDLIIEEYIDYSNCKLIVNKSENYVLLVIKDLKENLLELEFKIENYKHNKFITKNLSIKIPRKNINHESDKNKLLFPTKFTRRDYNDIIYNIKKKNDCRFYIYNDSNHLSVSLGYNSEKKKFYISCSFEYGESDGPIQMLIFLLNNSFDVTDELKKIIN
jgi:hypothetical protein